MKTKFKPPTEVMIRRVIDDDGSLLPYTLDDRLFLNQLGVSDEELADLYDALRTHPEYESISHVGPCLFVSRV